MKPGDRLGAYEITARLGEGGMGAVFRATDTRLRREVAVKVLPDAFTEDPDRLARFEREAQLLAQLHHPNIASIFGVEEAGGGRALVMELVEGATLADRLAAGAMPVDESVAVARQIAEGLEEAHDKGIIHRDLKPHNVVVTTDGRVKVLDFGLAKALDPAASSSGAGTPSPSLLDSPTLSARGTALGVVLGTAAYMAPEQAKGKTVDRRADIWAFGVVLWEMLTGRKLFAADTVAETLGHVMTREPDLTLLPRETPAALRDLIARCLVRDVRRRLQAIGDARIVLEEIAAGNSAPDVTEPPARRVPRWALLAVAVAGAAAAVVVLAVAGWLGRGGTTSRGSGAAAPRRAEILGISVVASSNVAIAPDGSEVIGYDMTPSRPALLRRRLDSFEVQRIPGTDGAFNPFYSPDGSSIGFFSLNQICVMSLASSTPRCLAPAGGFANGSWGADDTLVYSNEAVAGGSGLFRLAAGGGEARRLTTVDSGGDERLHVYPQVLPDGRNVLFTIVGSRQNAVATVPATGGSPRTLLANAAHGRFVRSGHLVYWDELRGRLCAVAFDPARVEVTGTPVELGIEVAATGDAMVSFDVSDTGTLVYSLDGYYGDDFTVELVDRNGRMTELVEEHASWAQPRVSPDGRYVLLREAMQPDCSLWLFDLQRRSLARVESPGDNHNPLWLPGGGRFLVSREPRGGLRSVVLGSLDGDFERRTFLPTDFAALGESVSPDLRFVALTYDNRRDRNDILLGDRETGAVVPLLASEYDEDYPAFSPDGAWLAYASNDTGRSEVYVRPFPGPGAKLAISTHGGTGPVWSRDGRELFYAAGTRMMRVAFEPGRRLSVSAPETLFENAEFVWERPRNYDVLPDGSGFVMIRRGKLTPAASSLRVVFNWFTELEWLAPSS